MPGWMSYKLESRYADDTTLMAESEEEFKEPLDESEGGEWKSRLKAKY